MRSTATLLLLLGTLLSPAAAQRVQWASEVVDFSSQLSAFEYSAQQVVGKPNALPQAGDNPSAWMPSRTNKTEFITVKFARPMRVQQIVIAESYNPSAVYQVYLYDRRGREYLVHTFEPKPIAIPGRILNIFINRTEYEVEALRLVLDGRNVPGYNAIDAIGISGSSRPFEVEIEQPQNLREQIVVERLDGNVNTEYEETRPLISPDGKTLYFSRKNHPENVGGVKDANDIWYSVLDPATGKWTEAKNIGRPLNTDGPNYISSITPDGNAMTVLLGNVYTSRERMKSGVSISTKSGDQWSEPKALDIINAYIDDDDGHYFLANNRRTLLMAVERFDSYGGKDLYVSFRQRDGRWSEPLNLGNDINTAHTEWAPYLAADNETLYFSSGGYSGYGGSDIYISRRLDDTWTNWTEPENLGPDINSPGDDVFFNIPPSGQYAYYTKSGQESKGDIHRIELPVFYQPAPVISIAGRVTDSIAGRPLKATISFKLLPEFADVGFTESDSLSGEYEVLLPAGSAYEYTVTAEGYAPVTRTLNLTEEIDFREITADLSLRTATADELTRLSGPVKSDSEKVLAFLSEPTEVLVLSDRVLFDFASDYLNEDSRHYLDRIATHMIENSELRLQIDGHTDNTGPEAYNMSLSRRRAQSVHDYLSSKGIAVSRLLTKGNGPASPIASNDTREGRRQNRRVEFRWIGGN